MTNFNFLELHYFSYLVTIKLIYYNLVTIKFHLWDGFQFYKTAFFSVVVRG